MARKVLLGLISSTVLVAGTVAGAPQAAPALAAATPGHVFVIMEENRSAPQVLADPYFAGLCKSYGCTTDYSGVTFPSLPNYLAITSGGFATTSGNSDCPTTQPFSVPNLFDQLTTAGVSWGAFAEDLPTYTAADYAQGGTAWTNCGNVGSYIMHHFPAPYYASIIDNPGQFADVQNYTALVSDLQSGTAPAFSWITPNAIDDGHNGTITDVQNWLQAFLGTLQASPVWQSSTVIVTWDTPGDSETQPGWTQAPGTTGGNVLTIVIGPQVTPGETYTEQLTHYSVLRALETAFGLPLLGAAQTAPDFPELDALLHPSTPVPPLIAEYQSAGGVDPSVTEDGYTATGTGDGIVALWLYGSSLSDVAGVSASGGFGITGVTLSTCGVSGYWRSWAGVQEGTFDSASGCASVALLPDGADA